MIRELYKSRKRTQRVGDACRSCAMKLCGKAKRKGFTLIGDGYYATYDNGKRKLLHRKLIEEEIGRKLEKNEVVHHIDGNKINNNIDNLHLMTNYEHQNAHKSLENIGMELYNRNLIKFDRKNNLYYLPNTSFIEESYGFEHIAIKQKKNICESRQDVNIKSEIFRDYYVDIPLIASNMSTVINAEFCEKLLSKGAFGFLHRAQNIDNYEEEVKYLSNVSDSVPISIGIGNSQYELAKKLIKLGANIIVIDIAHGYCDAVIGLGRKLKKEYPHIKMIVGNTVNIDMMKEVDDFADAVKVGIAQGFACTTKNTAGCTEKQFSAVLKFKEMSKSLGLPIISDGGIREPSDFVKSIAAGANSSMAGSIFAACPESAARVIDGKKIYAGMASEYVQDIWKGGLKEGTCAEGTVKYLEIGDNLAKLLQNYSGALKSGITYAGGTDVESMHNNVEFIRIYN